MQVPHSALLSRFHGPAITMRLGKSSNIFQDHLDVALVNDDCEVLVVARERNRSAHVRQVESLQSCAVGTDRKNILLRLLGPAC